ncbi:MAG: DNA-protecting protein DprA [Candidatus Doudnabacteria bacterium]|nr:DNA-protecting protein DprA [Candidatus Doudnabacteria bacterium]
MTNLFPNLYLHGLKITDCFSISQIKALCDYFDNDLEKAFLAKRRDLEKCEIKTETITKFLKNRDAINLKFEKAQLAQHNIGIISYLDDDYPELLREISSRPPLLYYRGVLSTKDQLCVSVVGTRKMSSYGRSATHTICDDLVANNVTIVSGLAYGIDSTAHKVAVHHKKPTIAVVASGLRDEDLYPQAHLQLARSIIDTGGALVSEYPIDTPALKQYFVARNRLIAGLSMGTVVVESSLKSGALITARYALEQNRGVYAVPGSIFNPESAGPNNLLKLGAKAVTSGLDILEDLNVAYSAIIPEPALYTPKERLVVQCLSAEPRTTSELIKDTNLTTAELVATLTFLEMKGIVKNLGAQQYMLLKTIV